MNEREKLQVKREYVEAAFELMQEKGFAGVSAREIGRKVGKTAPSVYRHFKSIDYLAAVASVRYLRPYYQDIADFAPRIMSPLDLNFEAWETFAYYMLQNIPVCENLFFSDGFSSGGAIEEYYQLYPDERINVKHFMESAYETTDLLERDRMLLAGAAEEGYISQSDVEYLALTDVFLFRGICAQHRNDAMNSEKVHEAVMTFVRLLYRTYRRALLPGKTLLKGLTQRYEGRITQIDGLESTPA